jgi:hypothetical protein
MKSILIIIGLGIVSLTASAQKDSVITRQVMLERDYVPTMQDASRINTQPDIYSPTIRPIEIKFVSITPNITLDNSKLSATQSGDIKTDVPFDKKHGYLLFGAGTSGNLDGAVGLRLANGERDRLDLFGTYSGTNSTVDYIDGNKYITNDVKAEYSNIDANLKYQHTFDPSVLSFGASFYNTAYNYYGNSFLTPESQAYLYPFDTSSKQEVNVYKIGMRLESGSNNRGIIKYDGNVSYKYFTSKYGINKDDDGVKGGIINADINVYTAFGADRYIGVRGTILNQSFSNKPGPKNAYYGHTNITGTPYIKFQGESWDADLGANFSALFDVKTAFAISPSVKADVKINRVNILYAELGGGVNDNTFLDILQENRYVDPVSRVEYSKTYYDVKAGFRSGALSGLEFDIFGGYKYTYRDHLYVLNYHEPEGWGNVGSPVYANITTKQVGGLLKIGMIPCTDLSAKIIGYFYNAKYQSPYMEVIDPNLLPDAKPWGRPALTAEVNADVKPIGNLLLSMNYIYAGGRKALSGSPNPDDKSWSIVNMKDINELNFRIEYKIADWVAVNARANNVLHKKYELQYGYTLQDFNFMGGISFKF